MRAADGLGMLVEQGVAKGLETWFGVTPDRAMMWRLRRAAR